MQSKKDEPTLPKAVKTGRLGVSIGIFLMLVSSAITLAPVGIFGTFIARDLRAASWKTADGVLLEARLDKKAGQGVSLTVPVVKYEYTVEGVRHRSDNWSAAGWGFDLPGQIAALQQEKPLKVYYNPADPAEAAVVRVPVHVAYLPLVWGLGFFFIFVVAMSGGILYAALHPLAAGNADSPARVWVMTSFRVGASLILTGLTGLITLIAAQPGGWWQWALSALGVLIALFWKRRPAAGRGVGPSGF